MGAGGSSEASVPGAPGAAGVPGAAGGGAQWGAIVVLLFLGLLVAYCCWGAPCCRSCCCRPRRSPPAAPNGLHPRTQDGARPGQVEEVLAGSGPGCTAPTIILLPQGRMLVVDGAVLSSLQADASGLDLIRLGENLVRAQRRQDSTILDAEAGLAGLAGLTGLAGLADLAGRKEGRAPDGCPPSYEELFGVEHERPCPPAPVQPAQPVQPVQPVQPPSYEELHHAPPASTPSSEPCNTTSQQQPQSPSPDGDQSIRESRV